MSLSLVLPMSVFALAASISPGPVNLVCLSCGTRYPLARGLIFVSGASLGFVALFLAIGHGLNSLLQHWPGFRQALGWAGAAFLLWLSYQLARAPGRIATEDGLGRAPGFLTGVLMQWLNPKAWLASTASIGTYTNGRESALLWLFAGLYLPICWLSLSGWMCAGAFLRQWMQRPGFLRGFNRTLAALLAGSCVFMLLAQD